MNSWNKQGLIIQPIGHGESITHCQPAAPLHLDGDVYRIFYGSRNSEYRTQTFYCDYDLKKLQIVEQPETPIIEAGAPGCFDEHGIYPASIVRENDQLRMYTIGYSKGFNNMFYMRIGLATSTDGKHFTRYSKAPLMNTSQYDPWIVTAPCVLKDGDTYRMWYVSGDKCYRRGDVIDSYYHIKYAESVDGINWIREGVVAIDYRDATETNIARPWIIKENGIYKAWYCYCNREVGYRIGYAESQDGYTFNRMDDKAGISISDAPWENEAIAYPAIITHNNKKYMFYNGNGFGKDGICLATQEDVTA